MSSLSLLVSGHSNLPFISQLPALLRVGHSETLVTSHSPSSMSDSIPGSSLLLPLLQRAPPSNSHLRLLPALASLSPSHPHLSRVELDIPRFQEPIWGSSPGHGVSWVGEVKQKGCPKALGVGQRLGATPQLCLCPAAFDPTLLKSLPSHSAGVSMMTVNKPQLPWPPLLCPTHSQSCRSRVDNPDVQM